MLKTYKIKHGLNLKDQLLKAKKVAEFVLKNKGANLTTKHVKHFGLKSVISKGIIRKISKNKVQNRIKSVKLTINDSAYLRVKDFKLYTSALKVSFDLSFIPTFEKVNQIELDETYCFISVTHKENPSYIPQVRLGVDRNVTGHCVVVSCPETGKVLKLGKKALFTHSKYKNIRKNLQKNGKFSHLKKIKNKESRIVKDLNHKISAKITKEALNQKAIIVLEDLKGIKKTKQRKSFRYSLNSWSHFQLKTFIEYKAKLLGVPVIYVAPHFTSQDCSKCGLLGKREGKLFKCPCGHVEHADANAGFNIAQRVNLNMFDCTKTEISAKALSGSACKAML